MKKILAISAAIACALGISSLQASPDNTTRSAKPRHSTIYITSVSSVGSHIPLVVRAYDGSIIPMSGAYVYGKTDIINTGPALGLGAALAARDPAITINSGR